MRDALRGFQQDPDNGEADERAARVAHKDFIALTENAKIQQDIRQRGGNHGEAPHRQAVLTVKEKDDAHRAEGDAGKAAQQAVDAVDHIEGVDRRPDGKQRQYIAERPYHQLHRPDNIAKTQQIELADHHHHDSDRRLHDSAEFYADIEPVIQRSHQNQHACTGQIEHGVREIVVGNEESETDTGINGNAADQWNQPLMTFTVVRSIDQADFFSCFTSKKKECQ